ncbi:uroporphyrinogen-III synthase [Mangrovimicrobium sediminis]|uniref:Uroporphyrinogen-III synthase n=2 Tax=Mangrovimicrobium sediminis TaxID=2562682 RepID=A0A4Z0M4A5_9GAMM|nr:uroporphyrinogen-III synthase [Haliea sp. SAOS-164]
MDALRGAQFSVDHQPLLDLQALPELSADARRCVLNLDLYQHVIFISTNAVRFGLECIDDYWPQLPVGIAWYAIGDATAALLAERGLAVVTPGDAMHSEGLLARPELAQVAGEKVLIVKGEGGRQTLASALRERGATVDELACYRRTCPQLPAGALAGRLARGPVAAILISSGEGLENLLTLLSAKETTKFRDIALVVPSPRVAAQAQEAGFRSVITANNASDTAMLQALQQWRAGD